MDLTPQDIAESFEYVEWIYGPDDQQMRVWRDHKAEGVVIEAANGQRFKITVEELS